MSPGSRPPSLLISLMAMSACGDEFTPAGDIPGLKVWDIEALEEAGMVERGRNSRYTMARAYRLSVLGKKTLAELQRDKRMM